MGPDFDVSSALELAAELEAAGVAAPAQAAAKVSHYGRLLHAAVVARAPGTNYPGTIHLRTVRAGSFVGVEVGTDRPDGFRREIGFHGVDSLRRRYSEVGKPHFGPGFNQVAPGFEAAMGRLGP